MASAIETPSTVRARIRYLNAEWKGRPERPSIHSRESRRSNTTFHEVEITDARPLAAGGDLDVDSSGFALFEHRSRVTDFHDADAVRASYYPEIEALLRRLTGATHVCFLHHLLRTESPKTFAEAYARYVHCDYSANYVHRMARRLMSRSGICEPDEVDRYDFAWLNTWQPIDHEVQRNPLALIDSRTLADEDVVEYTFGDSADYGQASMPIYDPAHRLYYFPYMQTDELIVSKQFDTRPGRARFCPHTSFDDSSAAADALPRRSIELRSMCAFPREDR